MSASQSPSITQYFKAQRKRPRIGKEPDGLNSLKKTVLEDGFTIKTESSNAILESDISKPMLKDVSVTEKSNNSKQSAESISKKKNAVATNKRKTAKPKKCKLRVADSSSSKEMTISAFVNLKASGSSSSPAPLLPTITTSNSADNPPPPLQSAPTPALPTETPPLPQEVVTPPQPPSASEKPEEIESFQKDVPKEVTPPPTESEQSEPSTSGNINQPSTSKSCYSSSEVELEIVGEEPKVVRTPVKFIKVASLSPAKNKKMTTEQVAKLLKKKTKLKDLRAALEGINQGAQKLSDFRRTVAEANARLSPSPAKKNDAATTPNACEGSATKSRVGIPSTKFYSPSPSADRVRADLERLSAMKVKSPSKLVNINNRIKKRLFDEQSPNSGNEKDKGTAAATAPAYKRLHGLAQKTPVEKGSTVSSEDIEADLSLPYNFKVLKELFVAVEAVLAIMKGRKECIIFPKVKAGVLELIRRVSLREKHLAQMATVLPGCYTFGIQKVGQDTHIKIDVVDLLPSVMVARRKAFHSGLIRICLEHHQKFLLSLAPPIIVPADKQITRWHPQFRIDDLPDIVPPEDTLPIKPEPTKISTAREVIAKAQNILENANPRMKQAVKLMIESNEASKTQNVNKSQSHPQTSQKANEKLKALKGVSQSLLEKIRNREQQKLLNDMTRAPAESKKLQMMKRLPNFIKIIRNMMVAEKKVALPLDTVVDRMSHSIQNLSRVDATAHIRLLVTLLPRWIQLITLSRSDVEYARIDKNADINSLLDEMDSIVKKFSLSKS